MYVVYGCKYLPSKPDMRHFSGIWKMRWFTWRDQEYSQIVSTRSGYKVKAYLVSKIKEAPDEAAILHKNEMKQM